MNFSLLPGEFNHSLQAIIVINTGKYILWEGGRGSFKL